MGQQNKQTNKQLIKKSSLKGSAEWSNKKHIKESSLWQAAQYGATKKNKTNLKSIYLSIWQATQYGAGQIPNDSSSHPPLRGRSHRHTLPGEFDLLLFVFSPLKSDRRFHYFYIYIFLNQIRQMNFTKLMEQWKTHFFIKVIFNKIWLPMTHWDS